MDDEDDDEEEHDDGPGAGAATLHRTYSRPKNVCRKSFVNYNSSSSYYMSSMSHDPAPGSSTRAARLPPYPYVREPSIPPLQHPLSGAGRRSKKQADKWGCCTIFWDHPACWTQRWRTITPQSATTKFFCQILFESSSCAVLWRSSISQPNKTFLFLVCCCMLTLMIMLTTSHFPYYTFCCNICKVHDQFARLSGI